MGAAEKQTLFSTTLGCVADFQNGGAWKESEYVDSGVPVTRVTNCQSGTVDLSGCKYLSFSSTKKYERHRLIKGDLIVATVGSHPTQPGSVVGRTSTVPESASGSLLNQNAVRLRAKSGLLDQRYLTYLASSKEFRDYIIAHARGAASQVRMSIELLRDMPLLLPPLPTQQLVASFLSVYDDLIENNTRRIEILEEMARRLYEEWFVQFRFPGHEGGEFKESELGLIPEGWAVTELEEVVHLTMGQSPSSEFYNEVGKGLPFHQGVTGFGDYFPSNKSYCTIEARVANEGDILFSVRAPVGRINVAKEKIVIGRGVSALRSKTDHQIFLLSQLRCIFKEEDSMGNGAIFKAVTKKDMQSIKLLQPSAEVIGRFELIAAPLWRLIRILSDKNTNLSKQRDLLLPKLISGEIDVSDIPMPT